MRITDCTIAYGDNPDRLCTWCGDPLAGRRRRWCSDACGEAFGRNHWWGTARNAALKRDGFQCQWCGTVGWVDMPRGMQRDLGFVNRDDLLYPRPTSEVDAAAAFGIVSMDDYDAYRSPSCEWWRGGNIRHAAKALPEPWGALLTRERHLHGRATRRRSPGHVLEVDHIKAAAGRHSKTDCVHHLDNLRTLCRECHRERTAAQRRGKPIEAAPVLATQGRLL